MASGAVRQYAYGPHAMQLAGMVLQSTGVASGAGGARGTAQAAAWTPASRHVAAHISAIVADPKPSGGVYVTPWGCIPMTKAETPSRQKPAMEVEPCEANAASAVAHVEGSPTVASEAKAAAASVQPPIPGSVGGGGGVQAAEGDPADAHVALQTWRMRAEGGMRGGGE